MTDLPVSVNLSPGVNAEVAALTPEQARAEHQAMRDNPNHDLHNRWSAGHVAAVERFGALDMRAHSAPTRTPAPLPDGPSAKELTVRYKAMMADTAGWRDGTITPDDAILLDKEIRLREAQEAAARPTATPTAPPVSVTFSERDLDGTLPKHWMAPERERYTAAVRATGLTPWEGALLNADLQTAAMTGAVDPSLEGDTIDFDELWGSAKDANIALVNGLMARLKQHSPDDERVLRMYANQSPAVANRLLELARARATRSR